MSTKPVYPGSYETWYKLPWNIRQYYSPPAGYPRDYVPPVPSPEKTPEKPFYPGSWETWYKLPWNIRQYYRPPAGYPPGYTPPEPEPAPKKPDVIDFLLSRDMQNIYALGFIFLMVKAAKDERVQKRLTRLITRLGNTASKFQDSIPLAAAGVLGWKWAEAQKYDNTGKAMTAVTSIVAMKMASSDNLAAGVAGVGYFAGMGIIQLLPFFAEMFEQIKGTPADWVLTAFSPAWWITYLPGVR